MTKLDLSANASPKRLTNIHNLTLQKQHAVHKLLDDSYSNQENFCALTCFLKKSILSYKLKSLIRENDFLKNLGEYNRNDSHILKSIINIINSKDSNGYTPLMKAIEHDDVNTLDYLLKKLTSKLAVYNKLHPANKIYLHNILDIQNNANQTAIHMAAISNINCYKTILKHMKLHYSNSPDFISDIKNDSLFIDTFSNAHKFIQNSFSLSVYWDSEYSNHLPTLETLQYNIISNTIYKNKQSLQKLFSESGGISKQKLNKKLNISKLRYKLDNITSNDPHIILSKFKILTDPDSSSGLTPVMQACKNNDLQTLSTLINEIESLKKYLPNNLKSQNYLDFTDSNYNTALSFSIKNNSIPCINMLLRYGATLGNDFEYTKSNSYILQAIYSKNPKILDLLIQHYKYTHQNKNSLKHYLSATTYKSNYLSPLIVAINTKEIDCAVLLFEKYSVPMPEQYKPIYDSLLKKGKLTYHRKKDDFISRIVKNLANAIIYILNFLGIIQIKDSNNVEGNCT